jgi:TonB family protein
MLHGVTGVAMVYVEILDDGSIGESRIYNTSGDDTLDSAALTVSGPAAGAPPPPPCTSTPKKAAALVDVNESVP